MAVYVRRHGQLRDHPDLQKYLDAKGLRTKGRLTQKGSYLTSGLTDVRDHLASDRQDQDIAMPDPQPADPPAAAVAPIMGSEADPRGVGEAAVLDESTGWLSSAPARVGDLAADLQQRLSNSQWQRADLSPVTEFGAVGEGGTVYSIQVSREGAEHTVLALSVPMMGLPGPSRLAAVRFEGEVYEPERADLEELADDFSPDSFAGLDVLPDADLELVRWFEANAYLRGSKPTETATVIRRLIFFGLWLDRKRPLAGGLAGLRKRRTEDTPDQEAADYRVDPDPVSKGPAQRTSVAGSPDRESVDHDLWALRAGHSMPGRLISPGDRQAIDALNKLGLSKRKKMTYTSALEEAIEWSRSSDAEGWPGVAGLVQEPGPFKTNPRLLAYFDAKGYRTDDGEFTNRANTTITAFSLARKGLNVADPAEQAIAMLDSLTKLSKVSLKQYKGRLRRINAKLIRIGHPGLMALARETRPVRKNKPLMTLLKAHGLLSLDLTVPAIEALREAYAEVTQHSAEASNEAHQVDAGDVSGPDASDGEQGSDAVLSGEDGGRVGSPAGYRPVFMPSVLQLDTLVRRGQLPVPMRASGDCLFESMTYMFAGEIAAAINVFVDDATVSQRYRAGLSRVTAAELAGGRAGIGLVRRALSQMFLHDYYHNAGEYDILWTRDVDGDEVGHRDPDPDGFAAAIAAIGEWDTEYGDRFLEVAIRVFGISPYVISGDGSAPEVPPNRRARDLVYIERERMPGRAPRARGVHYLATREWALAATLITPDSGVDVAGVVLGGIGDVLATLDVQIGQAPQGRRDGLVVLRERLDELIRFARHDQFAGDDTTAAEVLVAAAAADPAGAARFRLKVAAVELAWSELMAAINEQSPVVDRSDEVMDATGDGADGFRTDEAVSTGSADSPDAGSMVVDEFLPGGGSGAGGGAAGLVGLGVGLDGVSPGVVRREHMWWHPSGAYQLGGAFDVRRWVGDGVVELSIRVRLVADGVRPEALALMKGRALGGVQRLVNEPGHVFPAGDPMSMVGGYRLRVRLDFVEGDDDGSAHLTVRVVNEGSPVRHHQIPVDASPTQLVHELFGHTVGLRDETFAGYADTGGPIRFNADNVGSLMGDFTRPAPVDDGGRSLVQGGLRSRHLALIARLIGDPDEPGPKPRRVTVDPSHDPHAVTGGRGWTAGGWFDRVGSSSAPMLGGVVEEEVEVEEVEVEGAEVEGAEVEGGVVDAILADRSGLPALLSVRVSMWAGAVALAEGVPSRGERDGLAAGSSYVYSVQFAEEVWRDPSVWDAFVGQVDELLAAERARVVLASSRIDLRHEAMRGRVSAAALGVDRVLVDDIADRAGLAVALVGIRERLLTAAGQTASVPPGLAGLRDALRGLRDAALAAAAGVSDPAAARAAFVSVMTNGLPGVLPAQQLSVLVTSIQLVGVARGLTSGRLRAAGLAGDEAVADIEEREVERARRAAEALAGVGGAGLVSSWEAAVGSAGGVPSRGERDGRVDELVAGVIGDVVAELETPGWLERFVDELAACERALLVLERHDVRGQHELARDRVAAVAAGGSGLTGKQPARDGVGAVEGEVPSRAEVDDVADRAGLAEVLARVRGDLVSAVGAGPRGWPDSGRPPRVKGYRRGLRELRGRAVRAARQASDPVAAEAAFRLAVVGGLAAVLPVDRLRRLMEARMLAEVAGRVLAAQATPHWGGRYPRGKARPGWAMLRRATLRWLRWRPVSADGRVRPAPPRGVLEGATALLGVRGQADAGLRVGQVLAVWRELGRDLNVDRDGPRLVALDQLLGLARERSGGLAVDDVSARPFAKSDLLGLVRGLFDPGAAEVRTVEVDQLIAGVLAKEGWSGSLYDWLRRYFDTLAGGKSAEAAALRRQLRAGVAGAAGA